METFMLKAETTVQRYYAGRHLGGDDGGGLTCSQRPNEEEDKCTVIHLEWVIFSGNKWIKRQFSIAEVDCQHMEALDLQYTCQKWVCSLDAVNIRF